MLIPLKNAFLNMTHTYLKNSFYNTHSNIF